jgi:hypothetical protein
MVILQQDIDGEDFAKHWSYQSIIGKLNFLEKSTRPDIAYAVHQCARFSANPKASHSVAVRNIVRYLIGAADQGIIIHLLFGQTPISVAIGIKKQVLVIR